MDLPQVSRSISEQPSSRSQLDVSPIDKVKPETRDMFSSGIWKLKNNLVHTDLIDLAGHMPDLVLKSKAPATVYKYERSYNSWKKWSSKFKEITCLPAHPFHVALYLTSLVQGGKKAPSVMEAIYGISWAHKLACLPDPCKHDLIVNIREAALRTCSTPVKKKEPVTCDTLKKLVSISGKTPSLLDLRFLTMSLLSFAGFFRFSEVVNIRRSNIKFKDGFMSIFVENSKTDVYRDGRHVLIAATGSDLCPVNMLNRYLIAGNVAETSNEYIFRQLSFCKSVQKYVLKGQKPLSYTRAREIFIEKFKLIGEDVKKVGLHSFRSGGATAAANAGVTDRLFKRHGRWASDKAKDGYIKDNVSELLSVSSMLGL
ncbi:uncharacterized protein LOC125379160 [Haliotis rufescens]|nr:uncharacterized protein LOC125372136 [Haliotis rufescens]XP_048251179.1 uncharacterized protein LOC125379160 [Haliotis rufescens]